MLCIIVLETLGTSGDVPKRSDLWRPGFSATEVVWRCSLFSETLLDSIVSPGLLVQDLVFFFFFWKFCDGDVTFPSLCEQSFMYWSAHHFLILGLMPDPAFSTTCPVSVLYIVKCVVPLGTFFLDIIWWTESLSFTGLHTKNEERDYYVLSQSRVNDWFSVLTNRISKPVITEWEVK